MCSLQFFRLLCIRNYFNIDSWDFIFSQSSCSAEPANLRNARSAILEELPRIMNTMSLLWSVIKREDSQKRPTDFFGTTKGSSSVYFKATKVGALIKC